jgi:hypothetical protein
MNKSSLPEPGLPRVTAAKQFISATAVEAFFDARRHRPGCTPADVVVARPDDPHAARV